MGEVIAFELRPERPAPSRDGGLPAGPAAILFFTGVRYERMDPPRAEPAPVRETPGPKRPRRRRRA